MQLTVLPNDDRFTHSRRSCLARCNRKHQIAYELGLRPIFMPKPLRMGDSYHSGLRALNEGATPDEANAVSMQTYNEPSPGYMTDHEWGVERETVLNLINGYAWRWGTQETYDGHRIRRILAAELPFDLVINGVRYCGKIDAIAELWDGRLAVVEYKTASDDLDPGSLYWLRLRIDGQISGYYVAARMLGFPVVTVLYDVTCKPSIRPKQIPILDEQGLKIVENSERVRMYKEPTKKQREAGLNGDPYQAGNTEKGWVLATRTETPQEFGDRLRKDIADRPGIYYARQEIPRLESDLEEWKREVAADQHMLEYLRWKNIWPRNSSACNFGHSQCEYFKLCHNGWVPSDGLPEGYIQVEDRHQEIATEVSEGATT